MWILPIATNIISWVVQYPSPPYLSDLESFLSGDIADEYPSARSPAATIGDPNAPSLDERLVERLIQVSSKGQVRVGDLQLAVVQWFISKGINPPADLDTQVLAMVRFNTR